MFLSGVDVCGMFVVLWIVLGIYICVVWDGMVVVVIDKVLYECWISSDWVLFGL